MLHIKPLSQWFPHHSQVSSLHPGPLIPRVAWLLDSTGNPTYYTFPLLYAAKFSSFFRSWLRGLLLPESSLGPRSCLQLPHVSSYDSGYIFLLFCHTVLSVFSTRTDRLSTAPGRISSGHICVPSSWCLAPKQVSIKCWSMNEWQDDILIY